MTNVFAGMQVVWLLFQTTCTRLNCRLCGSYFKPRVPDLIAGCVAPISNHVYPTFYVPTLARHNISMISRIIFHNDKRLAGIAPDILVKFSWPTIYDLFYIFSCSKTSLPSK